MHTTTWRITKYKCDETGKPYGTPIQSLCFTQELMEAYKNPKFVVQIEEKIGENNWKIVWVSDRG